MTRTFAETQHKMNTLLHEIRAAHRAGALTVESMRKAVRQLAGGLTDDVLTLTHAMVWTEYAKDEAPVLRPILSELALEHYRRLMDTLRTVPTDELFTRWEADTTPESLDPVKIQRNYAQAYQRTIEDRLGEKAWDAIDAMIDEFADVAGETLEDRLARWKTAEIAALKAVAGL